MTLNAFKVGVSSLDVATLNSFLRMQDFALIYTGSEQDSMTDAGTTAHLVADYSFALKFTTGVGKTEVTRIELDLAKDGTGADLTVELRGNDFNPDGSAEGTVLATITVPKEFLPVDQAFWSIPINVTGLTASTVYWLVVKKAGNVADHVHLYSKGIEKDTAHKCYKRAESTGAWIDLNDSIRFKVFEGTIAEYLQDSMLDDTTTLNTAVSYYYMIKFTTGAEQTEVTTIELDMRKLGTGGGDFVVELRANDFDTAGSTLGTLIKSVTVPAANVPTTEGFYSIAMAATGLTANTAYWIRLTRLGNASNNYGFLSKGSKKDADHVCYRRSGTTGAWTDTNDSFRFKIYAGTTLQDSMTDVGSMYFTSNSSNYAFKFTTGSSVHALDFKAVRVELDLDKEGNGAHVQLELRDSTFATAGVEGNVLSTAVITASSLGTSKAYHAAVFSLANPLEAGTAYWVIVKMAGDSTNRFRMYTKSRLKSAVYKLYSRASSSGSWADIGDSIRFKAYEVAESNIVHGIYGDNGHTTVTYTDEVMTSICRYLPPSDGPAGGIRDIQTYTWSGEYLLKGVTT